MISVAAYGPDILPTIEDHLMPSKETLIAEGIGIAAL